MRERWVYLLEIILALVLLWMGVFGVSFFFINGPRSAAITLGLLGVIFYFMNTMEYVMRNPFHPVSLIGSVAGAIGVILLVIQIFNWNIWIIGSPVVALMYFAVVMCIKGVMGFFMPLREES